MALTSPSSRPAMEALAPEDWPSVEALVTEDDTPVDNIFSEKQQRLLVESLYSSWAGPGEDRPFVALANVGLFYAVRQPPFVLDMLLNLDVHIPSDVWVKSHRSYFIWEYGKPPDVVIEIVSNQKGEEAARKLRDYARIGIDYYVIFDPSEQLGMGPLQVYCQHEGVYRQADSGALPTVRLEVRLWQGVYEGLEQTWLRWYDHEGRLLLTSAECAEQERQRAEQEHQRVERLTAQLRALGVEPDENR